MVEMKKVQRLTELAVKISAFLHESQKERGRTAGFLGSQGKSFQNEMVSQRSATEVALKDLKSCDGFQHALGDAESLLQQLDAKRRSISTLQIAKGPAITYYTEMNAAFLDALSAIANESNNGRIVAAVTGWVDLMLAKERAGLVHALGVFA